MSKLPILIVIPARLHSSRLPKKMLADIQGKPMLQWVYEACQKAGQGFQVQIAVDCPELMDACAAFGACAMLTSDAHESGSSRCLEVWQQLHSQGLRFKGLINVQGDEPFIEPALLQKMGAFLQTEAQDIVTAASPISNSEEIEDPNCVKVGISKLDSKAAYFSRQNPESFKSNQVQTEGFFKHLGIYGFPANLPLEKVLGASTPNSRRERLEQLAWMDFGFPIRILTVAPTFGGVDSADDLERARAFAARGRF